MIGFMNIVCRQVGMTQKESLTQLNTSSIDKHIRKTQDDWSFRDQLVSALDNHYVIVKCD